MKNDPTSNPLRIFYGSPCLLMSLLLMLAQPLTAANEEHLAILKDAEQSRGDLGRQGIVWIVSALTEEGGEQKMMRLKVITQSSNVFAEIIDPEKSRGTKYIVADGNMWFHKPSLSRPISISRRQRVMGNAAVGDVAAISFLHDYEVEAVEEGTHENETCHVFTLKGVTKAASYPLIRYWVSKKRHVGTRAEFYSVSGAKLRTAFMKYGHKLNIDGRNRDFLSEMIVEENLGSTKSTKLTFGDFGLQQFPEETFKKDSLAPDKKIRPGGPKRPF
uniref:ABC efflux pump inner membrane subunit n=1 Tax=uncultured bacterium 12-5D TaxID=1497524 RepID=A0A059U270_9BACT|nr:ABC efflux pump inner membrane subunit [uncultured bacterium 12-5D]